MTDLADFLPSIIANPDDDLPRLVAADWLDDYGQPERAEFIRVQVELAKPDADILPGDDGPLLPLIRRTEAVRDALRRRERELLEGNYGRGWRHFAGREVVRRMPQGLPYTECLAFTRGFVSSVTLSWADWQAHAAALLAACPLRRVNRPRECEQCQGSGHVVGCLPAVAYEPCTACRGTGTVDDWRGDGVVRLTTPPAVDAHRDEANGRTAFRLMPNGTKELTIRDDEAAYAGPGWSAEMMGQLLTAEWPGVHFELPAVYGESDVRLAWPAYAATQAAQALLARRRPAFEGEIAAAEVEDTEALTGGRP